MDHYNSLREIVQDKDLAKLGDSLVNFMYSLAKSLVLKKPDAWKVSDKVLSRALEDACLLKILPKRSDRHSKGDAVEALLAYAWLVETFDLKDAVMILRKEMDPEDFSNKKLEVKAAVKAFKRLLEEVIPKIETLLTMRKVKKVS
jgi:hypothetical protein